MATMAKITIYGTASKNHGIKLFNRFYCIVFLHNLYVYIFIYLNFSVNEIGIGASILFVPGQSGADQDQKDKADSPEQALIVGISQIFNLLILS